MSGFRILPAAEAELDDIWLYIVKQGGSIDTASRVVNAITERFFLLALHPQLGRRRDYDLRPGSRSFAAGEYVILYRIEAEDILILHVLRGSRDILGLTQD